MAQPSSPDTDAPPAHQGAHYSNPSTKPLTGPPSPTERSGVQRTAWILLFALIAVLIVAAALYAGTHQPR